MPRSYPYVALAGKQLAPALRILIQSGDKQDEEIALLDTGANATAINAGVLESLDLRPVGEHRVSGPIGAESVRPFFIIDLNIAGRRYRNHPAFLSDRPYIIIGRDILNRHGIIFDGPKLNFTFK